MTTTTDRNRPHAFAASVPDYVGTLRIVALVRHIPGGAGAYQSAIVVTEETEEPFAARRFATHILIHHDDRDPLSRDRWSLASGHYRLTLADAARDAEER